MGILSNVRGLTGRFRVPGGDLGICSAGFVTGAEWSRVVALGPDPAQRAS
jgi:hypothetical protein